MLWRGFWLLLVSIKQILDQSNKVYASDYCQNGQSKQDLVHRHTLSALACCCDTPASPTVHNRRSKTALCRLYGQKRSNIYFSTYFNILSFMQNFCLQIVLHFENGKFQSMECSLEVKMLIKVHISHFNVFRTFLECLWNVFIFLLCLLVLCS